MLSVITERIRVAWTERPTELPGSGQELNPPWLLGGIKADDRGGLAAGRRRLGTRLPLTVQTYKGAGDVGRLLPLRLGLVPKEKSVSERPISGCETVSVKGGVVRVF